jgi:hypothetical protein
VLEGRQGGIRRPPKRRIINDMKKQKKPTKKIGKWAEWKRVESDERNVGRPFLVCACASLVLRACRDEQDQSSGLMIVIRSPPFPCPRQSNKSIVSLSWCPQWRGGAQDANRRACYVRDDGSELGTKLGWPAICLTWTLARRLPVASTSSIVSFLLYERIKT